jgi:S1-C subfamily serine protease
MITANILMRVFRLRTDDGLGTAFTIEVDGQQYLVTARHVLGEQAGLVHVTLDGLLGQSVELDFDSVPGVHASADVAAMRLAEPLTEQFSLEPTMDGMAYGQDCYFLGYPYGLGFGGDVRPELAFIKKAILSASDRSSGVNLMFLDGHNNPGFSGGPVVFYRGAGTSVMHVAGVIAGYRVEHNTIEVEGEVLPGALVQANSGIVVATDIAHVVETIRAAQS